MNGPSLFQRACNVTVGTLFLANLDVDFTVKRTLKPQPNTCDLKIYGLSAKHRKALEQATQPQTKTINVPSFTLPDNVGVGPTQVARLVPTTVKVPGGVPVKIEAGYTNLIGQIFLGELRSAQTVTEGANKIVQLSTGDGDNAHTRARVNVSFGTGTTQDIALRQLLKSLGVGQGNLAKALTLLAKSGIAPIYSKGAVLKGSASDHMTDFCRSAGLEWSIQDGNIQVLSLGQPLDGQAIRLAPDCGLVGSPSVDTKGVLSAVSLLNPNIKPGVKLAMDSESVKGGFRVTSVEYTGSRSDTDWYVKIEADRY